MRKTNVDSGELNSWGELLKKPTKVRKSIERFTLSQNQSFNDWITTGKVYDSDAEVIKRCCQTLSVVHGGGNMMIWGCYGHRRVGELNQGILNYYRYNSMTNFEAR